MFRRLAAVCAALVLAAAAAQAQAQSFTPFKVKDIRVEGLQRTEPGTIFSYLPVKVGETMALKRAYRTLYRAGLSLEDARRELEAQAAKCAPVRAFVEFLDASKRGIIR